VQVVSLTGMDVANASLLDEGTSAAEAINMVRGSSDHASVFVAEDVHPQTIGVVKVRCPSRSKFVEGVHVDLPRGARRAR
jgi:glycine cleavage system pyridoxal-binding protein P